MIITLASFKGGQAKSTSAIHLAAYFQRKAATLLVDGDPNRSVSRWASHGSLPFKVVTEAQAAMHARSREHIIIDTKARPDESDLQDLATGCHLLVLPCTPDPLSIDALLLTVESLKKLGTAHYRVLLTIVPPLPNRDGERAREALAQAGFPLFKAEIPRAIVFQRCILTGGVVNSEEYTSVGKEIEKLVKRSTE
jgi:chromosome partitioning protein